METIIIDKVSFTDGLNIEQVAQSMLNLAKEKNANVIFPFNETQIKASPTDNCSSIVNRYWENLHANGMDSEQKSAESYSPEVKQAMAEFHALNFGDTGEIIQWFEKHMPLFGKFNINFPINTVISKLESEGFERNANTGTRFDGKNRENFARYLIGQVISNFGNGCILPFRTLAKEWKGKFCAVSIVK
jgi:hypothetical protein